MKFYSYIPTLEGKEPMGTADRYIFELKTIRGAISRAKKRFYNKSFKLFAVWDIYDETTYKNIIY